MASRFAKTDLEQLKTEVDEIRLFVSEVKGSMATIKWLLGAANALIIGAIFWGILANGQIVKHEETLRSMEGRVGEFEQSQKEYFDRVNQQQNNVTALAQQITNILGMQSDIKVLVNDTRVDIRKLQQYQERQDQEKRRQ